VEHRPGPGTDSEECGLTGIDSDVRIRSTRVTGESKPHPPVYPTGISTGTFTVCSFDLNTRGVMQV
jgi:hypothetical protein